LSPRGPRPQRDRLGRELADALEALAEQEEQRGDPAAGAVLWRRRVELEPCLGRAVVGLMRSLEAAGDRAGAIRAAVDHAERLRRELGVEPDPHIVSVVERLRARPDPARRTPVPAPMARETGARAPPGQASLPTGEPLRLVGRGAERARLEGCWRRASKGHAVFALISGEPGIGKTRLADEVVAWAARRRVVTARARCYASEGRPPFAPVTEWLRSEALRSSLRCLDSECLAAVAVLLPEEGGQEPGWSSVLDSGGRDWQRQRFFRGLAEAVLGSREPRVLFVDDLQWCDPDTLQWLHFLLRHGEDAPMLVLGTARADEAGAEHPLSRLVETLKRDADHTGLTELELEPLSPDSTAALAGDMASRPLREDEVDRLFRETEGNPLFVVEAVRAGWLSDTTVPSATGTGSLPERVRGVIRSRLARLSSPARTVAAVGATAGRAFRPGVARLASGLDDETLADALDELTERRIIHLEDGTYGFTHEKLRQVAYEDLNPVRRMLFHGRVAAAMQQAGVTPVDAMAGAIASHWERAGDAGKAVALYRRAAEVAAASYGHEEAAAYLSRALQLLPSLSSDDGIDRMRLELSLQRDLGETLLRTRGWAASEVAAVHERLLELAETAGDDTATCHALWGLQGVHVVRSDAAAAHTVGQRMLALARTCGDLLYLACAHETLSFACFLMGDLGRAAEHAAEGLQCYDRHERPGRPSIVRSETEMLMICLASHIAWFRGRVEEAALHERSASRLADRVEYPFVRATALTYMAMLHQFRGDVAETARVAEETIRVTDEYDFPYYASVARILRGWAAAAAGHPEEGLREIHGGLQGFEATGARIRHPYYVALEADVYARMGRTRRAVERLDHARRLCGDLGELWYESELERARQRLCG
jgi:tetratricopeptide (TPR) repeat protein